jgi:hypothetical protein
MPLDGELLAVDTRVDLAAMDQAGGGVEGAVYDFALTGVEPFGISLLLSSGTFSFLSSFSNCWSFI